jgi:hypothetical protein
MIRFPQVDEVHKPFAENIFHVLFAAAIVCQVMTEQLRVAAV